MDHTWQIPRVIVANTDLGDDRSRQREGKRFPGQVLEHDFFVGGLESESRWQFSSSILDKIELVHTLKLVVLETNLN